MRIRVIGDRVHLSPVVVRSSGAIVGLERSAGAFWSVLSVGSGEHADSIREGDVVAIRMGVADHTDVGDGTVIAWASDVWCAFRGQDVVPVGDRVAIRCDADPEETTTACGLILLRHDVHFPTTGTVNGVRVVFDAKAPQYRVTIGGQIWVIGDRERVLVGEVEHV